MAETGTALTSRIYSLEHCLQSRAGYSCTRQPAQITRAAMLNASAELGLSRSRVFELVARYRAEPVTSSLVDRPEGFPKGRRRLAPEIDQVIASEIERFYLTRPKPTLARLQRDIRHACYERGLRAPTRKTIAARVAAIDRERLTRTREGAKAASDRYRPVIRSYTADYPLQIVQIDHTPADIIIVDEHFRKPLGRPTLTLQIDIATRVIPGFYISLEKPSATSVGMAIRHAVLPRQPGFKNARSISTIPSLASPKLCISTMPQSLGPGRSSVAVSSMASTSSTAPGARRTTVATSNA
jgi:putative transposase